MLRSFTLTGDKSEISVKYSPPIELKLDTRYSLGLAGFYSSNSIPNVDVANNKFYCESNKALAIHKGTYTVADLETRIHTFLEKDSVSLRYDPVSKKIKIKSIYDIDFRSPNSLVKELGFEKKLYEANKTHIADLPSEKIVIEGAAKLFYYNFYKEIIIETGIYKICDLEKILKTHLGDANISLKINYNTQKCELLSNFDIDFQKENTFHRLLGFSKNIYKSNNLHIPDLPVQVLKVITVRVDCNITTGSYYNNDIGHTIYQFGIEVDPGYAISQVPKNIIYYPVNTRTINNITLKPAAQ